MELFTDRELDAPNRNVEYISKEVWHGIRALILRYRGNNGLATAFPKQCPDFDYDVICGCNNDNLDAEIHAFIPRINHIETYENQDVLNTFGLLEDERQQQISDIERTYDILDLIEFIYYYLRDFSRLKYHEYYQHHHLIPANSITMKETFREEINDIFRRNLLIYELNANGKIERVIPVELDALFRVRYNTKDSELNKLLDLAYKKFLSRQVEERKLGLEKLWDAFERLKTIECTQQNQNKKVSAECVLAKLGNNNKVFVDEVLRLEMMSLTNIGNNFRIRHHETNKIEIVDSAHIDYLFYRMMSFINLFLNKYNIQ